jgi:hypothetical protein
VRVAPVEALAAALWRGPRPVAVLVGAGASQTAGLATGEDLLRGLAARRGEDPGDDPVGWYVRAYRRFPDYFGLVRGSGGDRLTLPRAVFEGGRPTPAHRALAGLAARGVLGPFLTTNLDRLLERALTDAGLAPRVAYDVAGVAAHTATLTAEATAAVPAARAPGVVKLHGDYLDLGIRDAAPLHAYPPAVDALLDLVLRRFDLLVCGWSANWDVPLSAALERTAAGGRRTYWLQCGEPGRRARGLIAARRALVARVPGSDAGLGALAAAAEAADEAADEAASAGERARRERA